MDWVQHEGLLCIKEGELYADGKGVSRSNMAELPLKVPAVPIDKGGCASTSQTTARHAILILIAILVEPVVFAIGRSKAKTTVTECVPLACDLTYQQTAQA